MTGSARPDGRKRYPPCSLVALYVHVPFCRARCAYCDFNTYAGLQDMMTAYGEGLRREIEAAGAHWGRLRVSTVFVGGGTPSLFPLHLVDDLLNALRTTFDLAKGAEITFEANPGTVDQSYLSGLCSLGVDRLSLGVQSAHEDELEMLGRIHDWGDAVQAVDAARASGFENLNLDLLFGLPGQSLRRWEETLMRALTLDPEHLSLYGLSVERGTLLAERIASGDLAVPDDDRQAAMYELAEDMLGKAGFFHYEISNWAKADPAGWYGDCRWWPDRNPLDHAPQRSEAMSLYLCRHNMTYWRNEPWLGIGAGAHSWMTADLLSEASGPPKGPAVGKRWANVNHPEGYAWASAQAACLDALRREVELIDRKLEMGETMMLALRLAEGMKAERFQSRFGVELRDVFGEKLKGLRRLGLLTWDGLTARLTARGRLLGNRVFECFI